MFFTTGLTDLTIPASVTSIAAQAFGSTTTLKCVYWKGEIITTPTNIYSGSSKKLDCPFTAIPSFHPTGPSIKPTRNPTYEPSYLPTLRPSVVPTPSPEPSKSPTCYPSTIPTTFKPTNPTARPSMTPSFNPSLRPSHSPTYCLFPWTQSCQ
jgi:hypothetical protein